MRKMATFAAATIMLSLSVGCSSEDDPGNADGLTSEPTTTTSEAAPTTTTEPAPTTTTEPAPIDIADVVEEDPAITGPAIAACEAFGDLDTEGGLDALLALFAPDVVVSDAMTGEQYTGADDVATYFESLVPTFGIEASNCGDVVQSANWVAGTYALLNADGPITQGIAAMHITDGLVDQQINHYTPVGGEFKMAVDNGSGVLAIGPQYCEAFINRDVETALRLMTADPIYHTRLEFVGTEAVTAFIVVLPYEIHTCGEPITSYNWDAMETIMTDPETGAERTMLHVLELDPTDSGKISQHWFYFDEP